MKKQSENPYQTPLSAGSSPPTISRISKYGLVLFTCVYFVLYIAFLIFGVLKGIRESTIYANSPMAAEFTPQRIALNISLSFVPILIASPFLGRFLGKVIGLSKRRFLIWLTVSSVLLAVGFTAWMLILPWISQVITKIPPGLDPQFREMIIQMPIGLSAFFFIFHGILFFVLYLIFLLRPNLSFNSDATAGDQSVHESSGLR